MVPLSLSGVVADRFPSRRIFSRTFSARRSSSAPSTAKCQAEVGFRQLGGFFSGNRGGKDAEHEHKVQGEIISRAAVRVRGDLPATVRGRGQVAAGGILLMADEAHREGRRPDWHIAEVVDLSLRQVVRIRQQFVREGATAIQRKPRPPVPGKLDGKAEAQLVTLCCSLPPKGRERWTLQLLCDELARLQIVESICRETVRSCLKKTTLSLGGASFCIPEKDRARFVAKMEEFSTSTRRRTTRSTR